MGSRRLENLKSFKPFLEGGRQGKAISRRVLLLPPIFLSEASWATPPSARASGPEAAGGPEGRAAPAGRPGRLPLLCCSTRGASGMIQRMPLQRPPAVKPLATPRPQTHLVAVEGGQPSSWGGPRRAAEATTSLEADEAAHCGTQASSKPSDGPGNRSAVLKQRRGPFPSTRRT